MKMKETSRAAGKKLQDNNNQDQSVYDAMVGLAQSFLTHYPLVEGHGNFGSIDGDSAAAMRYTEARLSSVAESMMELINKDTVDFVDNFDSSLKEPSVLPTLFPALLANGCAGIAVGMATNIPPFNLSELYDALICILDNAEEGRETACEDIERIITGPDFPTAAYIDANGVKELIETGRASITMRAKYEFADDGKSIIVTELPYKVNKATLISKISDLIREGNIDVKSVRDESDKDGIRIYIELKKGANSQFVLNNLLKKTELCSTYSANIVALVDGMPRQLNVLDCLNQFLSFATSCVMKATQYDLNRLSKRRHIIEGLQYAIKNSDSVIAAVKNASSEKEAVDTIISQSNKLIDEVQAKAIYDLKVGYFNKTSGNALEKERKDITSKIDDFFNPILTDQGKLLEYMKSIMTEMKNKFGTPRKTKVINISNKEVTEEDLIKDEDLVIVYTVDNLVKAVNANEYKTQNRGGKGVKTSQNEEIIKFIFNASSKDTVMFITSKGRCFTLKAYEIQKVSRTAKGKSINNYLALEDSENIVFALTADKSDKSASLLFATKYGMIKRLSIEDLSSTYKVIKIMSVHDGDEIVSAAIVHENDKIIMATQNGSSLRTEVTENSIRPMGRSAAGVIGMKIYKDDCVIGLAVVPEKNKIIVATENGYGKLSEAKEYTLHNRGGYGMKCEKVTDKTGKVIFISSVSDSDELLLATLNGQMTRIKVSGVSTVGRATEGVKLVSLNDGDKLSSVSIMS